MAAASDSKSDEREFVWVQVPFPPPLNISNTKELMYKKVSNETIIK